MRKYQLTKNNSVDRENLANALNYIRWLGVGERITIERIE